jgi:hypothetical protein
MESNITYNVSPRVRPLLFSGYIICIQRDLFDGLLYDGLLYDGLILVPSYFLKGKERTSQAKKRKTKEVKTKKI